MEGTLQPCCVIHARLSIPVSHALLSLFLPLEVSTHVSSRKTRGLYLLHVDT